MKPYNVYRLGSRWYYTIDGEQSEAFESKDAAEAAAQKCVIDARKAEAIKAREEKKASAEKDSSKG
jgi:hypothetical protein